MKITLCDIVGFLLIAVLWLPLGLLMLIASLFVCAIFGSNITHFGAVLLKSTVASSATSADLFGDLPLSIFFFAVSAFCTWGSLKLVLSGLRKFFNITKYVLEKHINCYHILKNKRHAMGRQGIVKWRWQGNLDNNDAPREEGLNVRIDSAGQSQS
jgi:hypothetical protein